MTKNEFVFIYSTVPDREAASRIARVLVGEKLAACVNIHGPLASVYEWEGKMAEETEFAAFIKTRAALVDRVVERARPLHPYTTPCFLVLPIEAGNEDYLAWVRTQTRN